MTTTNRGKIRFLRGKKPTQASQDVKLYPGQPFYDTDTGYLYVGKDDSSTVMNSVPVSAGNSKTSDWNYLYANISKQPNWDGSDTATQYFDIFVNADNMPNWRKTIGIELKTFIIVLPDKYKDEDGITVDIHNSYIKIKQKKSKFIFYYNNGQESKSYMLDYEHRPAEEIFKFKTETAFFMTLLEDSRNNDAINMDSHKWQNANYAGFSNHCRSVYYYIGTQEVTTSSSSYYNLIFNLSEDLYYNDPDYENWNRWEGIIEHNATLSPDYSKFIFQHNGTMVKEYNISNKTGSLTLEEGALYTFIIKNGKVEINPILVSKAQEATTADSATTATSATTADSAIAATNATKVQNIDFSANTVAAFVGGYIVPKKKLLWEGDVYIGGSDYIDIASLTTPLDSEATSVEFICSNGGGGQYSIKIPIKAVGCFASYVINYAYTNSKMYFDILYLKYSIVNSKPKFSGYCCETSPGDSASQSPMNVTEIYEIIE